MAGAIDAEEADGRRNRRLLVARGGALQAGQRLERAFVADLSQREGGIVLERAFERGAGGDGVEGIRRLVVAERLDHDAAEKILPPTDVPHQRLLDASRLGRRCGNRKHPGERRERPDERRPDELRLLLVERGEQRRHHRAIRVVLEETVGDRPQTIVGAGHRLSHRVLRPGIVEAGQQDERAIADVAVGVLGHGLKEHGNSLRRRNAADRPGRVAAGRIIEIAELVDGGLELRRRHGLGCRGFLGGGDRGTQRSRRTQRPVKPARIAARHDSPRLHRLPLPPRPLRPQPRRHGHGYSTTAALVSSFSASCR